MAQDFSSFDLNPSILLQYIDDLLLCNPSLCLSQRATSLFLNYLGSLGYGVSPSKAQLCSPTVIYLDIQLSQGSKTLTNDQVWILRDLQPPFLSLVGFFRHLSLNFAIMAKSLYQTAKEISHPLSYFTAIFPTLGIPAHSLHRLRNPTCFFFPSPFNYLQCQR